MKKTLLSLLALIVISSVVYITLFFQDPEEVVLQSVRDITTVGIERSPTEQAQDELNSAKQRLDTEESRLLDELNRATSTAADEIRTIENRRDMEVEAIERQIAEINAIRTSF